jgi:hypothetical protein
MFQSKHEKYVKPRIENNTVLLHRNLVFDRVTTPYAISIEQVNTLEKLVKKQSYLKDYYWYTDQISDDFFELVVNHHSR